MIQLNKTFLYSNPNKQIPVLLSKLNYGFASESAQEIRNLAIGGAVRIKHIHVLTPSDAFVVVMLMKISGSAEQIVKDMKASPPGVTSIDFEIDEGSSYNMYIMSKDYSDGFLGSEDSEIIGINSRTTKRAFTFENTTDESVISPTYTKDNPDDAAHWYNYDGSYQGELKWELTDAERAAFENSDNIYAVYFRSALADMYSIFKNNGLHRLDVDGEFDSTTFGGRRNIVNAVKALDEIFSNIQNLKQDSAYQNYEQIRDFVVTLETGDYFLDNQYVWSINNAHEWIEFKGLFDYNHTDSIGGLPLYLSWWHNEEEDIGGDRAIARNWLDTVEHKTRNPEYLRNNPYNMDYSKAKSFFEALKIGSSIGQIDNAAPSPMPEPITNAIAPQAESLHDEIKLYRYSINQALSILGQDLSSIDRGQIFVKMLELVVPKFISIRTFILSELTRIDQLIGDLGNFIFSRGPYEVVTPTEFTNLQLMSEDSTSIFVASLGAAEIGDLDNIYRSVRTTFPPFTTLKVDNEYMHISGHRYTENPNHGFPHIPWAHIFIDVQRGHSGSSITDHKAGAILYTVRTEDGDDVVPSIKLSHEATLMNIKYLRGLINSVEEDIWTHVINSHTMLYSALNAVRGILETKNTKVNTLLSLSESSVKNSDIEVLYGNTMDIKKKGFTPLNVGKIQSISQSLKYLDFSFLNTLGDIGSYTIVVKPKRTVIRISNPVVINGIVYSPDLDVYESDSLYGWNIEFFTKQQGTNVENSIGPAKTIVSAYKNPEIPGDYRLQISPTVGGLTLPKDVYAWIWDSSFVPILITMDITRHDIETLSYALYAKKELNTDTGRQIIYDYAGNIYDEANIGERAVASEGRAIVNYRQPV